MQNQVSQLRSRVTALNEENQNLKSELSTLNRLLTTGSRPIALKTPSLKLVKDFKIGPRTFIKDSIMVFQLINVTNSFSLIHVRLSEPQRAERNSKARTSFQMVVSTPRNSFCVMTINKTKIYGDQNSFFLKDCSIRNSDTNVTRLINTIAVQQPKVNNIYQLTHWKDLKIPDNAPMKSLLPGIPGPRKGSGPKPWRVHLLQHNNL